MFPFWATSMQAKQPLPKTLLLISRRVRNRQDFSGCIHFFSIPSLTWQGFDELAQKVDGRFFMCPGISIMLAEKGICGCDNDHVEFVQ